MKRKILSKYDLDNKEIAKLFGYNSAKSFSSSSKRDVILKAIETIILRVEKKDKDSAEIILTWLKNKC